MLSSTYIVACLCGIAAAVPASQHPLNAHPAKDVQDIREKLKKAEIIPTVIDDFLPLLTISVTWKKAHAKLGNTIKPKKLKEAPTVMLHGITTSNPLNYVVALTDPDAPARDNPEWSKFCHWIATNMSFSEKTFSILPLPEFGLSDHEAVAGHGGVDDVVEYKPPAPPKKTGKHRYVFLVFLPRNGTSEPLHLIPPKERKHWGTGTERGGVREWSQAHGLVPVAANFLYAQNKKQ